MALTALVAALVVSSRGIQSQTPSVTTRPDYDSEYLGPPMQDAVMQHNKETYVSFGCAYCHGLTLTPRGEAADLMHSALVGADVDGSTIVPLLKAGIPQTPKLSPMPQFSDLSDQQLRAIARYIHYARQQGRYREVTQSPVPTPDVAAGRMYFDQQCMTCHASDLNGIGRKYEETALRERLLRPQKFSAPPSFAVGAIEDSKSVVARQRHNSLLENFTPVEVANLVAYLKTR